MQYVLSILCILLAIVVLAVGVVCIYSFTYQVPEQAAKIENNTGLVQASGRALYDANGDILQLIGVNAGQILLQEGWMSPFATEALKNEDGSYVKDDGDNIQYAMEVLPEISTDGLVLYHIGENGKMTMLDYTLTTSASGAYYNSHYSPLCILYHICNKIALIST